MNTPDLLFVYGSLRSGGTVPMARELAQSATLLGPARMAGRVVDLGPYTGLIAAVSEADWVEGEVWRLHDPADLLPRLDDYEGCGPNDPEPHEFVRVVQGAVTQTGIALSVMVYVLNANRPS